MDKVPVLPGNRDSRICVIGAGPCGLTALKNLSEVGLHNITCYESGSQIGGNWVLHDAHGHSSIYETTHTISSRHMSEFQDFPMPKGYPAFPSHEQILAYFESYADQFDLTRFVAFGHKVIDARQDDDGCWQVTTQTTDGKQTATFDYLIVCSGHHWDTNMPELPGEFAGNHIHSHAYKSAEPFRDQRVLVIGGGNTACDIAVETSRVSKYTALSMRRGYYIIPKLILGKPVDLLYSRLTVIPKMFRQQAFAFCLRLMMGKYEKYGLQKPDCRVLEMHPTLNGQVLESIRHGKVRPRRGISAVSGSTVTYAKGRSEDYDTIISATGYRTGFPFLGDEFNNWAAMTRLPLYLKMMLADHPSLYFIGLFQPVGCIWTLADYQAKIAANHIAGRLKRPDNLVKRIKREMDQPHWRFQEHPRHAAEVDFHDFKAELLGELKAVVG